MLIVSALLEPYFYLTFFIVIDLFFPIIFLYVNVLPCAGHWAMAT